MKKKSLLMYLLIFIIMLVGGAKAGTAIAIVELLLEAPRKKLKMSGLPGLLLALAISYFMPLFIRRIFARGHAAKA